MKTPEQLNKTVFVGLSGGVDSSVAALRLIKAGYNVVGVFIKVWHPEFMVCNWEQERLDAMRVAAHLGIPFLTCDAEAAYKNDVADYFIAQYKAGRTPNPDVMCNQHVKFGRFLEFALEQDADYIATGHYAQRIDTPTGATMQRGVDTDKDQTYFLYTLSNAQLENTLFPVGNSPKSVIRAEAKAANIPVATKKDSQGICFLGHVDIPEFLSHYIDLEPGNVLNTDGAVIGTHKGSLVYTLGQRHGFTIASKDTNREPHFVVSKDDQANTLTVATSITPLDLSAHLQLIHCITRAPLNVGQTVDYQIRYRQTPLTATVVAVDSDTITLEPTKTSEPPASGQSCVLYDGSLCIGGGIVA